MEISLHRKTLAALAAGLAGVAAQAAAPVIIGPGIAPALVALVAALAGVLAVHLTPNSLFGADVNEVAAATFRVAMEEGWDADPVPEDGGGPVAGSAEILSFRMARPGSGP